MYKTENSISLQSKKWIIDAILKLMEQKKFQDITIKEIAIQAKLDRRTFYRNFDSKEDVLSTYIKLLTNEYINILLKTEKLNILICLESLLLIAKKHKSFLIQLKENNLFNLLIDSFNQILPTIHNLIEGKLEENFSYIDSDDLEYIFAFNIGGFWNILIKWINSDFNKSPQEIVTILNRLKIN